MDLTEYRRTAIDVCNRLALLPIAMEFFEAMSQGATASSLAKLSAADVYVGLVAHRYGYVEPGYGISVTEAEFDEAGRTGIPRLCFRVDPNCLWPPSAVDHENFERLETFRRKIDTAVVRQFFTTADDFAKKLTITLVEWQRHVTQTRQPADTAAPPTKLVGYLPSPPALFVGRGSATKDLIGRLGMTNDATLQPLTVIRGLPGIGKSAMMAHLAWDDVVAAAFPDGIFWASLGEAPDVRGLLLTWARALVPDTSAAAGIDEIVSILRARLMHHRALLLVDDVWSLEAGAAFKLNVPGPAIVMSTRFTGLAAQLATKPADIYPLQQLTHADAIDLLGQVAPEFVRAHSNHAHALCDDLEGLPLTLRVAGRLLEFETSLGADIRQILDELRNTSRLADELAPDDRTDLTTGSTPTVRLVLQRTTERLEPLTRERFAWLGDLPPDPRRSIWARFALSGVLGFQRR